MILLTPTGDRPESFALCERWMQAQTLTPDHWIVIDDGIVPTRCTMGQTIIRLPARPQKHTLTRNLAAGLSAIGSSAGVKLCIVEDDDHYAPGYLAEIDRWLDDADLVGEGNAFYYRLDLRSYRRMGNTHHASLAATGVKGDAFAHLTHLCQGMFGRPAVDLALWRSFDGPRRLLFGFLVTQMKGGRGRAGKSIFHRRTDGWTDDPDGAKLRERIGPDAEIYLSHDAG